MLSNINVNENLPTVVKQLAHMLLKHQAMVLVWDTWV